MNLPQHLAIIMDGNGRWAQSHGHARSYGHVKGTRVAKKIITHCSKQGVQWLTLYAFSSENWFRPTEEVSLLMTILFKYLRRETKNLVAENIRLHVIGELEKLPDYVKTEIEKSVQKTSHCTGLNLVFCLSYGSRQELTSVMQNLAEQVKNNQLQPKDITPETINGLLWTSPAPEPDLIIRTSGEMRLSNFLLWQSAYSEFWFTNTLWPDFTTKELDQAFLDYSNRSRRFGAILTQNLEQSNVESVNTLQTTTSRNQINREQEKQNEFLPDPSC